MIYTFFDKMSRGSGVNNEIKQKLLKRFKKEKYIHHLKMIVEALI